MKRHRFSRNSLSTHPSSTVNSSVRLILVVLSLFLNCVECHQFVNQLIKSPIECFCFGSNASSPSSCVPTSYGIKVITSDFQSSDLDPKELSWQIVNLTSFLVNRNLNKLIYDFRAKQTDLDQHQTLTANFQVATIDLSNDLSEFLQPLHQKNYLSFADDDLFNENLYYWQSPGQYTGDRLYAYGNELQFKLSYSVLRGDVASNKCNYERDPDVLMVGLVESRVRFIGFKWTRYQGKFKCDIPITVRIKLVEAHWFWLDSQLKMTNQTVGRLQFSLILNSLRALFIRASYHSDQIEARLYTVSMGITDPTMEIRLPFLAKSTEKCVNCPGNRDGLYCDTCKPGYYGNAILDHYCRPCQCPGTPGSESYHAKGCYPDARYENRAICQCKPGYLGERCDRCDINYHLSDRGECKRCECNGNVDFSELGVCDPANGKCRKCLFNTEGDHCERCKTGYFGDALRQSCRPCATCNSSNLDDLKSVCDHKHPHNHSLYHHCDLCPSGYFKKFVQIMDRHQRMRQHFSCESCNCSPYGSLNNGECESGTGRCICKHSFTGLKCADCAVDRGYEKYGFDCISCSSNQTNSCINALKNDIQQLQDISRDYSFETLKSLPVIKLNDLKDQASRQSERTNYLIEYEQRVNQVIANASKLIPDFSSQLEMDLDVGNSLANRSETTIQTAIETKNSSDRLLNRLRHYYSDLNKIITIVNATRKGNLNNHQCDLFLEKSNTMLAEIQQTGGELDKFRKAIEEDRSDTEELLQNVKNSLNLSSISMLDSELIDRMLRLTNISFDAFEIYEKQFSRPYLQTLEIIGNSNQLHDQVQEMLANASISIQEMNGKLNESFSKLELAKQNLTVLSSLYDAFPSEFNNLKTHTIEKLMNTLRRLNPQNEEKYASMCQIHAQDLRNKADGLRAKFNSTLSFASKYENQTTKNSRYNRIIDTIRIIHESVNETEEKVQDLFAQIYSEKESDEQTDNRNKKSKALAGQIEQMNKVDLKEISSHLMQSKQLIDSIQNRTFTIDEINSNLKSRNRLLLDIEDGLKELTNKSSMFKGIGEMFPNTNGILNAYNEKINKFNSTILQNYWPRINILKSRKALLDGNTFVGEIDKIQTNIENKSKYIKSFEIRNRKMEQLHREMHSNLNEIITKIRLARQKASLIKISIRNRPVEVVRNGSSENLRAASPLLKLNNNLLLPPTSTVQPPTSSGQPQASGTLNGQQSTPTGSLNGSTAQPLPTTSTAATPAQQATNESQIFLPQPVIVHCKRSYESELEPSSVNTISLTFTINEQDQPDSLFLYVGGPHRQSAAGKENAAETYNDFFVLEMVDRRIRFVWNAGSGVQVLEHPLRIEPNNLNLSDRDKWYKVQVLRLATTAHLTVQPLLTTNRVQELSRTFFSNESLDLFEGLEQNQTIFQGDNVVRTRAVGNSIKMDFDKSADILVGSLPDDWIERDSKSISSNRTQIPDQIKSRQMAGYLFDLAVDGHNVALWNFRTNTAGCAGSKEGITEERPSNMFRFKQPFSYAMLPQINRYNSLKYLIQLNIRTFNDNALLFFTCNPTTGDHIILSLIEGRIRFQVVSKNGVDQNIGLDLMSKEKYNSGQLVNIAAERDNLEGLLRIDGEQLEDTIHILPYLYPFEKVNLVETGSAAATTNMFTNSRQLKLDLSDQFLFIGGLPLNFTSSQCFSKLQTTSSFDGCIKDIQIDTTPLNLLRSDQAYYGVDDCFDQASSHTISFNADAYMEFNGQALGNFAEFSFTFRTLQPNALLVVSMFDKRDFQDHFESFYLHNHYRVLLKSGHIVVKIKASSETDRTVVSKIILVSKRPVNDNQFHTLVVIKRQRKISLFVDDEECGTLRFSRKVHNVQAPSVGGLYVGGLPTNFQPTEELELRNAFNGTLKDLVFNRKLMMDFNFRKIFLNG